MKRPRVTVISLIFLLVSLFFGYGEAFDVQGDLFRVDHLNPGGECQGVIGLYNPLDSPESIQVYITDYFFSADGTVLHEDPSTSKRSNAQWINFQPKEIRLEAKQRGRIEYRIKVPEDVTDVGTFWSLVHLKPVLEDSLMPKDSSNEKKEVKMKFKTRSGYSIQMITNIGNGGNCKLELLQPSLENRAGMYSLRVDFKSVGNLIANVIPWVEIYDHTGQKVGTVEGNKRSIYPGCSVRIYFPLGQLKQGEYKALLIADCGNDQVFGGQYELEIE